MQQTASVKKENKRSADSLIPIGFANAIYNETTRKNYLPTQMLQKEPSGKTIISLQNISPNTTLFSPQQRSL